ncbi:MAG: DNA polymerase I [Alteromonadaceae bacterium]|nr:DNA polymerase I [Alteromonadaceae bacterium]
MTDKAKETLVLVDGSSYLFRAFHGLPPLTNSKGMATGAVYGVINMLRSLLKQYNPTYVAVVFDPKGKTFRDDIYPEYKANRPPMPDELRDQIKPLHEIIKSLGLPLLVEPNVEADDVIGTLARMATEQDIECIISTGDKDMAQLVNSHVSLINTMTNTVMDEQGVVDKFGVPPSLIIDYLGLKGDKVDNIPGVPGVGDKSAVAMLNGIGGIKAIYENLDKLAELDFRGAKKMAEKIAPFAEQAALSYELATIKLDVELEVEIKDLVESAPNKEILAGLYKELEFNRWYKEVSADASSDESETTSIETNAPPTNEKPVEYSIVYDMKTLDLWLDKLTTDTIFAFDTETTSLDYMEAELVGFSLAVEEGKACYVPLAHDYPGAPDQLNRDEVLNKLKPILESSNFAKVGQHLKYDKNILANYGIELKGIANDTMLASYVLNSVAGKHDMDSLAQRYLSVNTVHFEEIAGKGAKQLTFNQIDIDAAGHYAAEDADITLRLHNCFAEKIKSEPTLKYVLDEIEVPLASVLAKMEQTGVLIDPQFMQQLSHQFSKRILELEKQVHELAGTEFNLGSTKQLQTVLFEQLELPVIKKTPKGAPSTSEEVLIELAHDYEIPKLIMEFRGLSKLKNTYTDKLPLMLKDKTGRVHTSYHQAVAVTGRLSSTDPNLQNIPIKNEAGRSIRKAFIAPEGYKLVAADYSQIELRIMAHLSGDKGLLNAFSQGQDIHKATAAEVFSVPLEEVTVEQRRKAKAINFGLIYGMSAFGLSRQLDIPRHEAQEYMELYFDRYPGVLEYMETTREFAKEKGYVETVFGRRLYLPDINARNGARRKGAERAAINAPMQGTAADIIKLAMLAVHDWVNSQSPEDIKMIMQVHDELVFEIKEQKVDEFSSKITQLMESATSLKVPLVVEPGVGNNWEEAH